MIKPRDNILSFTAQDWRYRKASREALRRDRIWFRKNPGRSFRMRPFRPNELNLSDGVERNITLAYLDRVGNTIYRTALTGDTKANILPDDDAFLGSLWFYIEGKRETGKPVDIDPLEHLLLLGSAGHTLGGTA